MSNRLLTRISALVFVAVLDALLVASCVITIGPGNGEEGPPDTAGNSTAATGSSATGSSATGSSGGQGGSEPLTPEEQAAIDDLASADPLGAAKTLVTSEYAAYALAGFVETNVSDPATLDDATLNQLLDQYAPIAWQQAQDWANALDPSLIPQAGIVPQYSCVKAYGCEYMEICDFDDGTSAACTIVGCGKGACPICPTLFNLSNLIVKNWCLFTCMDGSTIVGVKLVLNIQLFGKREKCLLLVTPVP